MLNKEMLKEEVCSDYLELTKIQEKIKEVQDIIDKKMSEWEELNENLNSFNEKA